MPEMTEVQEERIFHDTCIECGEPLEWEMDSDCRYVACCSFNYVTETQQQIAEFRGLLKTWLPKISVRQGRGTAAAWIDITGSQSFGHFTDEEAKGLRTLGLSPGANACVISPEDRAFWIGALRQTNYEMRQAGLTPAEHLQQLTTKGDSHEQSGDQGDTAACR